jgi:hypothetical protein
VTEDLDERYAGGPASTANNPFGSTPVHVPSLGAAAKAQLLQDLEKWVEELARRFVVDVRTIPPCWARHNAMVETLTALRDYERGCYVGTAPPTAAMEWIRALRHGHLPGSDWYCHAHRDGGGFGGICDGLAQGSQMPDATFRVRTESAGEPFWVNGSPRPPPVSEQVTGPEPLAVNGDQPYGAGSGSASRFHCLCRSERS